MLNQPTQSEIRTAKRQAVGGGRKRCRKGKNCSAACIAGDMACLVEMPESVGVATSKVVNFLQGVFGKRGQVPESPGPTGQPTRVTRAEQPQSEPPPKTKPLPEDERVTLYGLRQLKIKLKEEQRDALSDYSMDEGKYSYKAINDYLRNPPRFPGGKKGYIKDLVENIDQALVRLPKNKELQPFWRGVDTSSPQGQALYKALETAQPGTKLSDRAYSSYSFKEDMARKFLKNSPGILFISRNPGLTPINEFSDYRIEGEALLPRGMQQTIRSVTKEGETLVVELY